MPGSFGEKVLVKTQQLTDLPVLSLVRNQGLDLLQSPRSTRRDFAETLKYDQVLSAKILRLVNSSSYCLQRPVTNIESALVFLGDNTLRVLFLGSNVFSEEDLAPPFQLGRYWLHNYLVAFASARIAEVSGKAAPEEVFSCGLLHDLGKLALWRSSPETFASVLKTQREQSCSFVEAESRLNLPGHHVLGELVGRSWNLPLEIRKTMRFHHRDVLIMETLEEEIRNKIACVIVGNHIVKILGLGCAWGRPEDELAAKMCRALGIQVSDIGPIERRLEVETERISWIWTSAFKEPSGRCAA